MSGVVSDTAVILANAYNAIEIIGEIYREYALLKDEDDKLDEMLDAADFQIKLIKESRRVSSVEHDDNAGDLRLLQSRYTDLDTKFMMMNLKGQYGPPPMLTKEELEMDKNQQLEEMVKDRLARLARLEAVRRNNTQPASASYFPGAASEFFVSNKGMLPLGRIIDPNFQDEEDAAAGRSRNESVLQAAPDKAIEKLMTSKFWSSSFQSAKNYFSQNYGQAFTTSPITTFGYAAGDKSSITEVRGKMEKLRSETAEFLLRMENQEQPQGEFLPSKLPHSVRISPLTDAQGSREQNLYSKVKRALAGAGMGPYYRVVCGVYDPVVVRKGGPAGPLLSEAGRFKYARRGGRPSDPFVRLEYEFDQHPGNEFRGRWVIKAGSPLNDGRDVTAAATATGNDKQTGTRYAECPGSNAMLLPENCARTPWNVLQRSGNMRRVAGFDIVPEVSQDILEKRDRDDRLKDFLAKQFIGNCTALIEVIKIVTDDDVVAASFDMNSSNPAVAAVFFKALAEFIQNVHDDEIRKYYLNAKPGYAIVAAKLDEYDLKDKRRLAHESMWQRMRVMDLFVKNSYDLSVCQEALKPQVLQFLFYLPWLSALPTPAGAAPSPLPTATATTTGAGNGVPVHELAVDGADMPQLKKAYQAAYDTLLPESTRAYDRLRLHEGMHACLLAFSRVSTGHTDDKVPPDAFMAAVEAVVQVTKYPLLHFMQYERPLAGTTASTVPTFVDGLTAGGKVRLWDEDFHPWFCHIVTPHLDMEKVAFAAAKFCGHVPPDQAGPDIAQLLVNILYAHYLRPHIAAVACHVLLRVLRTGEPKVKALLADEDIAFLMSRLLYRFCNDELNCLLGCDHSLAATERQAQAEQNAATLSLSMSTRQSVMAMSPGGIAGARPVFWSDNEERDFYRKVADDHRILENRLHQERTQRVQEVRVNAELARLARGDAVMRALEILHDLLCEAAVDDAARRQQLVHLSILDRSYLRKPSKVEVFHSDKLFAGSSSTVAARRVDPLLERDLNEVELSLWRVRYHPEEVDVGEGSEADRYPITEVLLRLRNFYAQSEVQARLRELADRRPTLRLPDRGMVQTPLHGVALGGVDTALADVLLNNVIAALATFRQISVTQLASATGKATWSSLEMSAKALGTLGQQSALTLKAAGEYAVSGTSAMVVDSAEYVKRSMEPSQASRNRETVPNWDAMGTVPLRSIFGSGEYHVDGVPYRVRFHNYNTFFGDTALTRGKWYYEVTVKDITGKCQIGWATERFLHRSAAVPPDEQVCVPLRPSSSHGGEKVPPPSPSQGSWTWLPSFSSSSPTSTTVSTDPASPSRSHSVEAVNREAKLNAMAAAGAFGVGDDEHSWSFDGFRSLRWHDGKATVFGRRLAPGDVVGVHVDVDGHTVDFTCNGQLGHPFGRAFAGHPDPNHSGGVGGGGGRGLWDLREARRIVPAVTGTGTFEVNFGDRPFAFAPAAGYHGVHAFKTGAAAAAVAAAAAGMFRLEAGPPVPPALAMHGREEHPQPVVHPFAPASPPPLPAAVDTPRDGQRVRPLSFRRPPESTARQSGF